MKKKNFDFKNLLLFLCPLVIYFPSFRYFFFQDDFIHLNRSFIQNFSGLLKFLKPLSGVIYFRPLALQLYFYLTRFLFGLNPLAFRLIAFSFFLLNIFLVKKLIKKITKDNFISFSVAFLFGISSIHFMSLFWICEFSVILGTFFFLLVLLLYPQKKSLLFFFLGLLSHELVAILPFLLFCWEIAFRKRKAKLLASFFLLLSLYFVFRFFLFPIPLEGTYKLTFGKENISAFIWYVLWTFNLPEELKYQTVLSELKIQKEFVLNFLTEFSIWSGFLLFVLILILVPLLRIRKMNLSKARKRFIFFGASWFVLIVFLLALAPQHQYPLYLSFALPGFYLFFSVWLFSWIDNFERKSYKLVMPFFLLAMFLVSLTTVRFTRYTHWTVQEAKWAEFIIGKIKKANLATEGDIIFFLPNNSQFKASLSDQEALKVFYGETTKTFYEKESSSIKYKDSKGGRIINL